MRELAPLPRSFYECPAEALARKLLGARLVRWTRGRRLSGWIVETEAYVGEKDLACHARAGRTRRTAVMYGPPGHAYVYFTYGAHWLLNVVADVEGFPAAVLIRAILPEDGLEVMDYLRPRPPRVKEAPGAITAPDLRAHGCWLPGWTDGPAKLCQALAITGAENGLDLTDQAGGLWLEPGAPVPDEAVLAGPRVGIQSVPEPWLSMPWRLRVWREVRRRPAA